MTHDASVRSCGALIATISIATTAEWPLCCAPSSLSQEAMLGLEWPSPDVQALMSLISIPAFACCGHVWCKSRRKMSGKLRDTKEFKESLFKEAPEVSLLSSRVLAAQARAAFGIFQATRARGGLAAKEFREWHITRVKYYAGAITRCSLHTDQAYVERSGIGKRALAGVVLKNSACMVLAVRAGDRTLLDLARWDPIADPHQDVVEPHVVRAAKSCRSVSDQRQPDTDLRTADALGGVGGSGDAYPTL